ncbi:MAG: hypothetical protein HC812_20030 [Leptolyngbya sp. RL_3_1]|nr:hypothetical protein [Leptolyngbya sp. RL_3_1]
MKKHPNNPYADPRSARLWEDGLTGVRPYWATATNANSSQEFLQGWRFANAEIAAQQKAGVA